MKLLILSAFLFLAHSGFAQDYAPIRASTTVHGDGTKSTTVTNPEAATMEETVTDASGKTLRKTVYQLDERNQPKNAIFYDAKGKVLSKAVYERDTADRIAKETIFAANDAVLRKRIYTYGANNKVSGIEEFDGSGRPIPRAVPATKTTSPKRRR